jgi:hypothetical protein
VPCQICSLPPAILEELNKGFKDGVGLSVIASWLYSKGHRMLPHSMGNHFRSKHHERKR